MSRLTISVSEKIATITLRRPASLNAMTVEDYADLANSLREVDQRKDVLVTVVQATGRWFCAGTDVKKHSDSTAAKEPGLREQFTTRVFLSTTDASKALYSHSKILVAALNGPVMGIAAALLGQFDFIYAMPNTWLSVPFTFLGIVAEGGSSVTFANRMGVARANDVLLWGKKMTADELLTSGFINHIFPQESTETFHATIRKYILEQISVLDPDSLLTVKRLLRAATDEKNNPDAANMRESYAQAERFASGAPARQFARIARKEIKHKL
jgi:peroxisomal 3,2-trans-enoyl-CoA isomerase